MLNGAVSEIFFNWDRFPVSWADMQRSWLLVKFKLLRCFGFPYLQVLCGLYIIYRNKACNKMVIEDIS
jgi:hypothetical protein